MRLVLGLLFTLPAWATSCGILPPCEEISPGMGVFLAVAAETRLAGPATPEIDQLVPIRMKLQTKIYGKSPGAEFTWETWNSQDVHIGDVFYIAEDLGKPLRASICGISGRFSESLHAERMQFFQELAAGKHRETSIRLLVNDQLSEKLPNVRATLSGSSGTFTRQTAADGLAEWKGLPSGRYSLSIERKDYAVQDPARSLAPVELAAGACLRRFIYLASRYSVSGVVRTPDGRPAPGVAIQLSGSSHDAVQTDPDGRFTVESVSAGEHTIVAGDFKAKRNPYPTTSYPGIQIDGSHPTAELVITVPPPVATRKIVLRIPDRRYSHARSLKGTLYSQSWSEQDGAIVAVVRADSPLELVVTGIRPHFGLSKPIHIPAGTQTLTIPVEFP